MAQSQINTTLAQFGAGIRSVINSGEPMHPGEVDTTIEDGLNEALQYIRRSGVFVTSDWDPAHAEYLNRYLSDFNDGKVTIATGAARLPKSMPFKALTRLKLEGVFDIHGIISFCLKYLVTPFMIRKYDVPELLYYATTIPLMAPKAITGSYPSFIRTDDDLYHLVYPDLAQPQMSERAIDCPQDNQRFGPIGSEVPRTPESTPDRVQSCCHNVCRMQNVTSITIYLQNKHQGNGNIAPCNTPTRNMGQVVKQVPMAEIPPLPASPASGGKKGVTFYPEDQEAPDVNAMINQYLNQQEVHLPHKILKSPHRHTDIRQHYDNETFV